MTVIKDLGKVAITLDGEHDVNKAYEKLTEVRGTDGSYISIIDVPADQNIPLSNATYWQLSASDGVSSYSYTAYATDSNGTGWTLTYAEVTTVYTATISSNVELDPPTAADFAGATWVRNTGLNGVTVPVDLDIYPGSANAAESGNVHSNLYNESQSNTVDDIATYTSPATSNRYWGNIYGGSGRISTLTINIANTTGDLNIYKVDVANYTDLSDVILVKTIPNGSYITGVNSLDLYGDNIVLTENEELCFLDKSRFKSVGNPIAFNIDSSTGAYASSTVEIGYKIIYQSNRLDDLEATKVGYDKTLYNYAGKSIIVVDQQGGGDFITIQEAVDAAQDTINNPITILIKPGIYLETVDALSHNYLSFVGVNKATCIIKDTEGVYQYEPLKYCGVGLIANLTLTSNHDDWPGGDISQQRAYALHADFGSVAGVLEVNNCNLLSEQAPAIGSGLHTDYELRVVNCDLKTIYPTTPQLSPDFYGAFYVHDKVGGTATNQKVQIKGNRIRTNKGTTYSQQNTQGSAMDCEAYNNICYSETKGTEALLGAQTTLSTDSFGNNAANLNA